MTEQIDDLATPGCVNCCVKHLSAALAHLVTDPAQELGFERERDPAFWCSVAYVNLLEAAEGYESHRWYAIGAIQMAEECCPTEESAVPLRNVRLAVTFGDGSERIPDVLWVRCGKRMAAAHLFEAARELPALPPVPYGPVTREDAIHTIVERLKWVSKEFLSNPTEKKGGE